MQNSMLILDNMKNIVTPIIGIPKWSWKKKAIAYAKSHPNIIRCDVSLFSFECARHKELISHFLNECDQYDQTEYWEYQKKNGKTGSQILKKIRKFKELFDSLKSDGFRYKQPPIITSNGCRLDGSHRLSIVAVCNKEEEHLVNVVDCDLCFDKKKAKDINNQVRTYRKKVYSFDN